MPQPQPHIPRAEIAGRLPRTHEPLPFLWTERRPDRSRPFGARPHERERRRARCKARARGVTGPSGSGSLPSLRLRVRSRDFATWAGPALLVGCSWVIGELPEAVDDRPDG